MFKQDLTPVANSHTLSAPMALLPLLTIVVGKMISPQNPTIAATAVGIVGREGELFRFLIRWSIGLILFICVLVYLQSTSVLGWMV